MNAAEVVKVVLEFIKTAPGQVVLLVLGLALIVTTGGIELKRSARGGFALQIGHGSWKKLFMILGLVLVALGVTLMIRPTLIEVPTEATTELRFDRQRPELVDRGWRGAGTLLSVPLSAPGRIVSVEYSCVGEGCPYTYPCPDMGKCGGTTQAYIPGSSSTQWYARTDSGAPGTMIFTVHYVPPVPWWLSWIPRSGG